ncbi:MAG: asparagine synthetase B, partial [Nanoarchaeota archaeon]|nr:asparagine synthetase B [Nanoarchaeota archaeon]
MCGIAGYFGANDKQLLRNMAKAIKHRGPDDGGFFFHKNVGLANRRLSIIDIKSGHQPIVWKNLSIVYNGEIYNYQDIRAELEDKYDFKTNSDTEVILYAYQEWGPDCVKK